MSLTKVTSGAVSGLATSATTDTTDASNITTGTIPTARLDSTLDLSGKTVTLPAASVTAHATNPTKASIEALGIDASSLTGSLPAISGANLTGLAASFADLTDTTVSASDPTVSTNPSSVGHLWINSTSGEQFVATDITAGNNVWKNQTGGSDVVPTKGLTSADPATGAQQVADTGGTTGVYYINNYTTGGTTQQVYCWLGVNGDNWQKFHPTGNHLGVNHGHTTFGCTGTQIDSFSATTANQASDYDKGTGTSGCGGASANTSGWFGAKRIDSFTSPFKIMFTTKRQNQGGNFQVSFNIQANNNQPTGYADDGSGNLTAMAVASLIDNQRSIGIAEFNWTGSSLTMSSKAWAGDSVVPSTYVLNSSATTAPTGNTHSSAQVSSATGSDSLWLKLNAWADYAPDTRIDYTAWITT